MAKKDLPRFANLRDGELVSYAQRRSVFLSAVKAFALAAQRFREAFEGNV